MHLETKREKDVRVNNRMIAEMIHGRMRWDASASHKIEIQI